MCWDHLSWQFWTVSGSVKAPGSLKVPYRARQETSDVHVQASLGRGGGGGGATP